MAIKLCCLKHIQLIYVLIPLKIYMFDKECCGKKLLVDGGIDNIPTASLLSCARYRYRPLNFECIAFGIAGASHGITI